MKFPIRFYQSVILLITALQITTILSAQVAVSDSGSKLIIVPGDALILVGEAIQYQAIYFDSTAGTSSEVEVDWTIDGKRTGNIDTTGYFEAFSPGDGLVKAKYDSISATTHIIVRDTTAIDSSGYNSITITGINPGNSGKPLHEGDFYRMRGLRKPFDILNGSRIYFPLGSLDEDIEIDIQIPEFAEVKNGELNFRSELLNGLTFEVTVNDTIRSPYYFKKPISVAISYPPGQLKKMGITPEQLTLVFVEEDISFDTTGISNVLLDASANRIFASIEHFSTLGTVQVATPSKEGLSIKGGNVALAVGDSVQLEAIYKDSSGTEIDTTFDWTVSPDSLATIDSAGFLRTLKVGSGRIFARLDSLVDSLTISITEELVITNSEFLSIIPADTTVNVRDSIQFQAVYHDTAAGEFIDTTATWSLSLKNGLVGSLSSSGQLLAMYIGTGLVSAYLGNDTATALVTVIDTTVDTTGVNKITIYRIRPDATNNPPPRTIDEGKEYVLAGLLKPLNVLNGSRFYFPPGSISEDIKIEIRLPRRARVSGDSVAFSQGIVGGFDADVYVSDTILVSPFIFERPISVAIPFKMGLLNNLGIDPASLGMFFEEDSAEYDTAGIYDTIVDTLAGRIFSSVAHFSTLVAGDMVVAGLLSAEQDKQAPLPTQFSLRQNYPNPFNPSTTIEYQLPKEANVTLTIYDMLGREVARLGDELQSAGIRQVVWYGRSGNGRQVASGIYFARLVADDYSSTIKLVLLK
ncbi:T9SS type A sorting domain-containing protein [Candidatus Neomarinimicrobiota bacterium]